MDKNAVWKNKKSSGCFRQKVLANRKLLLRRLSENRNLQSAPNYYQVDIDDTDEGPSEASQSRILWSNS